SDSRPSSRLAPALALHGVLGLALLASCAQAREEAPPHQAGARPEAAAAPASPGEALRARALSIFGGPLPARADAQRPASAEQIALGRMLYHDTRLSRGQDIS